MVSSGGAIRTPRVVSTGWPPVPVTRVSSVPVASSARTSTQTYGAGQRRCLVAAGSWFVLPLRWLREPLRWLRDDRGPDLRPAAGLAVHGPRRPAAPDDVAVPAHDRVRGDQKPQPVAARFGYHAEQRHEEGPVRPVQLRAARLPPLQDRELVAQDQDFGRLPHLLVPRQPQPRG